MKGHRKTIKYKMASYNVLWNEIHITQRRRPDNLWRIGSNRNQHIDGMLALCSRLNIQEEQDEDLHYAQFEDQGRYQIFVRATKTQIEEMVQYLNEAENNNATRWGSNRILHAQVWLMI